MPKLVKARRIAEQYDLTPAAIYAAVKKNQLRAVRIGPRSLRFRWKDVAAWVAQQASR